MTRHVLPGLSQRESFGVQGTAEGECHDEYQLRAPGRNWRREVFKPNAFARLNDPDTSTKFHYFIEVDLGNGSQQRITNKCDIHHYPETRLFEETFEGPAFRNPVHQ